MKKPSHLRTGVVASTLLTAPLIGLMYLAHQWAALPFVPFTLFNWLLSVLPLTVRAAGFALTIATLLLLDQDVDTAIVPVGQILAVLLFLAIGITLGTIFLMMPKRLNIRPRLRLGLGIGLLFGAPIIIITLAAEPLLIPNPILAALGWLVLFGGWGVALSGVYRRLWPSEGGVALVKPAGEQPDQVTRRQFLARLGAGAAFITLLTSGAGATAASMKQVLRRRSAGDDRSVRQSLITAMENPRFFPPVLQARIYPASPTFQFPEFERERYRPERQPLGVCISGGGSRSFSAALGQVRALHTLGLLDAVGAISCVSGGAWLVTLWNYAPAGIDDATLLGPALDPEQLTLESLAELAPHCLGAPFVTFSTSGVLDFKTETMIAITQSPTQAFNRIYSRILNEFLLKPFGLDDTRKFFTLDRASVEQILARNPGLRPDNFYTMRPDRPFFMAGLTQTYPLGENQVLRHFEGTPLYLGTPQLFPGSGPGGLDIGGGYVESFAFDSESPLTAAAEGYATVPMPTPPFLLSDLMGSTGAAPGILLNYIQKPEWFPGFNYWSPRSAGTQPATAYSFVDGASLENLGLVPLLRRQYPVILAFVNSGVPLGSTGSLSVDGVDLNIARLFGYRSQDTVLFSQDAQIFPAEQFQPLAEGLKRAKAEGKAPIFVDSYPIRQPNPFDIPSYPDNGKVTVVWFYNDINLGWLNRLERPVRELLASTDPVNYLANFPHYDRFAQNRTEAGTPQLLQLTPQQINLIAHMWCYTVLHDAKEPLQSLLDRFA